jgi:selenocysteine-specific elongation factor
MHVVGTAGHVDHGKSTLVRALTGIDPDRFSEEKRRGLTIDLGFAWRTLPSGREIGIVDVPGHERFIRNMLAGAGGIDVALFVVAADEGFMPQSAEHLQVLDFLRVSGGVVALTKADLVGAETLELVRDDVWSRLRGTCLHDAEIVPVAATTGAGLGELVGALDDVLGRTPRAPDRSRPRMFVDRSFTIAGAGTVVTGTLTGGALRAGASVSVLPSGANARVRTLQTHERSVDVAVPGSRVAANLVGLERGDVQRGDAVVHGDGWLTTTTFAARLETAASNAHAFTERGAYELYVGSAELGCRVKFVEDRSDAIVAVNADGALLAGVRPGAGLLVQVFCDRALPIVPGDRYVIRDVGRGATVAGGAVLDVAPGTIRRGDDVQIMRLRAREGLAPIEIARRIVVERGWGRLDDLVAQAGVSRPELDGAAWGDVDLIADVRVHRERLDELRVRAVEIVAAHHREQPLDAGLARDVLVRELGIGEAGALLVSSWAGHGTFAVHGNTVQLPTHGNALGAEDRAAADRLLAHLRAGGASPPLLDQAGAPLQLVKAMERAGELVCVTPQIAYPSDVWQDVVARVVRTINDGGPATVSQLREALGTTRKYAVPLLEKLDASGVTRRNGDVRELGPRAGSGD